MFAAIAGLSDLRQSVQQRPRLSFVPEVSFILQPQKTNDKFRFTLVVKLVVSDFQQLKKGETHGFKFRLLDGYLSHKGNNAIRIFLQLGESLRLISNPAHLNIF